MAKFGGKEFLIQRIVVADGAWTTSHAYAKGDKVSNSSKLYRCTTAGTSASSGGPTGTSSAITDGSVVWAYVATTAIPYEDVAGMRSTSMTLNNEQVDVTDKGDNQWRELLEGAGIHSMELSASGMFTDAASHQQMTADVMAGTISSYRLISGAGDQFIGAFLPGSLERSGDYNGAEQYSLTLSSAGVVAYTAAP